MRMELHIMRFSFRRQEVREGKMKENNLIKKGRLKNIFGSFFLNRFFVLFFVLFLAIPFATAVNCNDPNEVLSSEDAKYCIQEKINLIVNLLTMVAGGLAVVAAIVLGIMFFNSSDPGEKDKLAQKLKMLVVGIVIIALANPIVKALM